MTNPTSDTARQAKPKDDAPNTATGLSGTLKSINEIAAFTAENRIDLPLRSQTFGQFRYMATNLGDETEPHFYYTVRGEKNSNRVLAVVTLSPEDYSIVTVGVRMNGMWWSTDKYVIIAKTHDEHANRFPQVTFRWRRPAWAPKFPNKLEFASLSISRSKMAFFSYHPEETETRHLHNISEAEAKTHGIPASLKDRSTLGGRVFSVEIDTAKKDAEIIRESRIQEFLLSVPVRTDAEIEAATPKGPRWRVSNGRRSVLV